MVADRHSVRIFLPDHWSRYIHQPVSRKKRRGYHCTALSVLRLDKQSGENRLPGSGVLNGCPDPYFQPSSFSQYPARLKELGVEADDPYLWWVGPFGCHWFQVSLHMNHISSKWQFRLVWRTWPWMSPKHNILRSGSTGIYHRYSAGNQSCRLLQGELENTESPRQCK